MFGKRVAHGALGLIIAYGLSNQSGIYEGTTNCISGVDSKISGSSVYRRHSTSGNGSDRGQTQLQTGQGNPEGYDKAGKSGGNSDSGISVDLYDESAGIGKRGIRRPDWICFYSSLAFYYRKLCHMK